MNDFSYVVRFASPDDDTEEWYDTEEEAITAVKEMTEDYYLNDYDKDIDYTIYKVDWITRRDTMIDAGTLQKGA